MNVLHLSSEKKIRGGERQILYLVQELNQYKVHNWIACRTDSAMSHYCQQYQWPYLELPFRNSFDMKSIWKLKTFCKEHDINIVHMHSGKSHSIAVLSTLIGNQAHLILSRRVFFPIKQHWFTKWKYNHSSIKKIICISQAVQKKVLKIVNYPSQSTIIYSGIDASRFKSSTGFLKKSYNLPEDVILIGVTAAIEPAKDLQVFVDTAALVTSQYPKTAFFIIGDGPEKEAIQQYISQKNLGSKVMITGFLTNVEEILPELDIFLMTSQTEGLGTSILDAFACRIPVVATDAGGIPEMVKHEKTGLLAPIKSSEKLAVQLLRLINQPSLGEHLAQQAFQLLTQSFTHQIMAQRTLDIYNQVMDR